MLRKFTLSLFAIVAFAFSSYSQGASIKGTVIDDAGEPLPFVNVKLTQNGNVKSGATTDFDGKFKISNLEAGKYDIEVSFVGYSPVKLEGIIVKGGQLLPLDPITLHEGAVLDEVEVVTYKVPLIDKDGGASGGTVTREDIARMPGRSATSIATTVGGVSSDANGNITSIRGARSDATYYYIDGIKVRGSTNLPKSAIEEVSVITGGLPANYGDATGGVISITTRGASRVYFGGIEAVTSGFKIGDNTYGLDHYGYNLIEGVVSGPLLMKKDSTGEKTDPILGFFISGNFNHQVDSRPWITDIYRVKPEVREALLDPEQLGPLRTTGTGVGAYYNSDYLTADDFETVKFRQNNASTSASLSGKLDVNVGSDKNLTFGATGSFNSSMNSDFVNSLMNYTNYAGITDYSWRAYGKFTQRFQADLEEGSSNTGGISNAFYTIMVDYSQRHQTVEDKRHKDKVFNYGYVGKFETQRSPSYQVEDLNGDGVMDALVHNGFNDEEVTFTPSEVNNELAAITTQYFTLYDEVDGNYENLTQVQNARALINGYLPQDIYGLWRNIGYMYNGYSQLDQTQFRITGQGSADIGDHALTIGFEYEQRSDKFFSVSPVGLWTQMRQLANNHIRELDESSGVTDFAGTFPRITYSRLNASPGEYQGGDAQAFFDYNLRQALGYDPDGVDYIDVDALDPNLFSLSMFSADELLNSGNSYVTYYGYDYAGKKQKSTPTFDDFFTAKDEYGNFTRPVAPYQPIYIAGYIMDKFAFDDLIFNVGLRVDRFDANQKVLKDPYLLYNAQTIGEVSEIGGDPVTHPESLPSDAVVYVNDIYDPTAISGYRVGSQWYDANGAQISDPEEIKTSTGIAPLLTEGTDPDGDISSSAFEDYKPQINVMPRVAFSFPISDEALFFAHYDVLTKRPTTGNRLDPMDYFYIRNRNVVINNPDLKPEKTIDYELGFQQVLSKRSSLKISSFYREQRNQVAVINVAGAYPRDYRTWGNIDFGTIKGVTLAYDLRRSGNVSLRAAYTLQFAEGTGSDPESAINLINAGQPNLRSIFPYSYDQRHAITTTLDYRYGEGKDYNGPVWGGKQVFKNTGVNVVTNFASGTPYSSQEGFNAAAAITASNGTLKGSVNGSRKPWQFRANMQIDRNFTVKFGEDKKKSANLNVYLLVNNLFNTVNVLNVYRATGNADDDGFLNSAGAQSAIYSQLSAESYMNYYSLKVNNPFNYGIPRSIRLGAKFDF